MKRLFYLFVAAVACLVSCDKNSESENLAFEPEQIVGSWYVDAYIDNKYVGGQLVQTESDSVSAYPITDQNYNVFVFENNGKGIRYEQWYDIDNNSYKFVKGDEYPILWSLSSQDKELRITDVEYDDEMLCKIKELSAKRLVLTIGHDEINDTIYEGTISLIKGLPVDRSEQINDSIQNSMDQTKANTLAMLRKWYGPKDGPMSFTQTDFSYYNNQRQSGSTVVVEKGIAVEVTSVDNLGIVRYKQTNSIQGNIKTSLVYYNNDGDSNIELSSKTITEYTDETRTIVTKDTQENYDNNGNIISKYLTNYSYTNGRLSMEETYYSDANSNDFNLSEKTVYSYQDDDNYEYVSYSGGTIPTRKTIITKTETERTISYYRYDNSIQGWTLTSTSITINNGNTSEYINKRLNQNNELIESYHSIITYDNDGRVVKEVTSGEYSANETKTYTYDNDNRVLTCTITDADGTRTETHSYEMLEEFVISDKVYVDDELVREEAVTVEGNKIITSNYTNQFGQMVLERERTIIL